MSIRIQGAAAPVTALGLLLAFAGSASAQDRSADVDRAAGAFERANPEGAAALGAVQANRAAVYAALLNASGGELPDGLRTQLLATIERPPAGGAAALSGTAREVIDGARALHRQILDLYAAPDVVDRQGAAEQAIDAYLAGGRALPASPKDPKLALGVAAMAAPAVDEHGAHGDHGHHGAHANPLHALEEGPFDGRFPEVNRLLWAQQWLEIALFEPVSRAANPAGMGDGVREVISRFQARLPESTDGRLTAMPTTPAISPELTLRHPRAAVILDNLHLLEMALLNQLATAEGAGRIESTVAAFLDPVEYTIEEYDWLVESLRRSVFLQGGPALGVMDRLDRNIGSPGDHRLRGDHPIMPGS
jgi:hypothetical protein